MIKTTVINMNRRAACATLSMLVLSAMSFAVPAASAKDGKDGDNGNNAPSTRSRTALTGTAIAGQTPNGHAEFRVDSAHGRARLNVEVEDVNLPAGTMLSVMVAGSASPVGTIKLDAFHSGELELNSEDGDSVPTVMPGSTVSVMNGTSAILSGVL